MLRNRFLTNRFSSAVETVIDIEDTDCDSDPGIDNQELDLRTHENRLSRSSSLSSSSSSSSSGSEIDLNELDNKTCKTNTIDQYASEKDDSDDSDEICFECLDLRTLSRSKGSKNYTSMLKCEKHRPRAPQPLLPPSTVRGEEVVMLPQSLPNRGSSLERSFEVGGYSGKPNKN